MKIYTVETYDAGEISATTGIIAPGAAAAVYESLGNTPNHFFNGVTFRVWEIGSHEEKFFKMNETKLVKCERIPEHELSM